MIAAASSPLVYIRTQCPSSPGKKTQAEALKAHTEQAQCFKKAMDAAFQRLVAKNPSAAAWRSQQAHFETWATAVCNVTDALSRTPLDAGAHDDTPDDTARQVCLQHLYGARAWLLEALASGDLETVHDWWVTNQSHGRAQRKSLVAITNEVAEAAARGPAPDARSPVTPAELKQIQADLKTT